MGRSLKIPALGLNYGFKFNTVVFCTFKIDHNVSHGQIFVRFGKNVQLKGKFLQSEEDFYLFFK